MTPVVRRVRVHPGPLAGRVRVPGDKSISHRSLLLGALVGDARVTGLAPSGDVRSTASALRAMGVRVELQQDDDGLHGTVVGRPSGPSGVLDCGNSGTGMRLLAGVCAATPGMWRLVGDHSLSARPMERVAAPLRQMGATVTTTDAGTPPIVVEGGLLQPLDWTSPVASAQIKSCILLAAAAANVRVSVTSPLPSRDHTERMLGMIGATIEWRSENDGTEWVQYEPSKLVTEAAFDVPGDPSSAAFWLVAAAVGDGAIEVDRVTTNPTRIGVVDVLRSMGAAVEVVDEESGGEPTGRLRSSPGDVPGGVVVAGRTVVDAIDELPILALAGALSRDGIEVREAEELRAKESDRITATAETLGALGIEVQERPDGFVVPGGQRPGPGHVDARGDHRIAMTAAVAGTLGTGPVEIDGFDAVATSYPTFLDDLAALGGRHEVLDHV